MASQKEEMIILVDTMDHELGGIEKLKAHELGRLHRAFSIFIFDGEKMLLQKRNPEKYHSGGLWTNACCSHPRVGEELREAFHRRLLEEAGFDTAVEEVYTFIYRAEFKNGLTEYELDHVAVGEYAGEVHFNEEEACDYRWISIEDLRKELVEQPETFTAWFLIACPELLKRLGK